jgi:hypothetical protein
MIKLRLQTFQLCTDMTHNAIPFHAIVMKVEQPPQQSPGNESIRVDSCCMRVLREKKTIQNVDCRRQFTLNKVPQQQNKTPNVLQLLSWCSVM